ncbi:uncharacterized protein B0T23DRAFT_395820 [Neurospora hispaniola]|uniref:Uncharacterized protein n=1 Tax=Neurospora hispaniola TaxID=588809 RepID=A0AAJ0I7M8_9PEZI|nr:hypothetical protein B0T23DRAFT_395820 [Neurospora hispaniola]
MSGTVVHSPTSSPSRANATVIDARHLLGDRLASNQEPTASPSMLFDETSPLRRKVANSPWSSLPSCPSEARLRIRGWESSMVLKTVVNNGDSSAICTSEAVAVVVAQGIDTSSKTSNVPGQAAPW